MFLATAPRNVSTDTGAAMLIGRGFRKECEEIGVSSANTFQDVEFCMCAATTGRCIVYVPKAVRINMESVSARSTYTDPATASGRGHEFEAFGHKLAASGPDPFHNASFDPDDERLRNLVARRSAKAQV